MEAKSEVHREPLKLVKGNQTADPSSGEQWVDPEGKAEEGKKRFRVAIVSMAAEIRTIYAEDGEEASRLVAEQDMGRPAGRQGPQIIAIVANDTEQSLKPPDFIQMTISQVMEAGVKQSAARAAAASRIVKPSLVLPPGFDPKGPQAS